MPPRKRSKTFLNQRDLCVVLSTRILFVLLSLSDASKRAVHVPYRDDIANCFTEMKYLVCLFLEMTLYPFF